MLLLITYAIIYGIHNKCVDGDGYYRDVWASACYNRGFLAYCSLDVLFLSGWFVFVVVFHLKYIIFILCLMFRRVHIAAKGNSPQGQ